MLRNIIGLWRGLRAGRLDDAALERTLLDRGLLNRLLGGRARGLIRASWHMYPVGVLMGLGLETASEITLLSLSASTALTEKLPLYAVLSLPLLFAAGMSAFDTADSLLMTRAYSWAYRNPARTLFYNIATTAVTVAIAAFIASVYVADVLVTYAHLGFLSGYASLADRFELFGYGIAGVFVVTWAGALLVWRVRRYDARYGGASVSPVSRRSVHPIEVESYEILRRRIDTSRPAAADRAVVERVVHASADLGYLADLVCDEEALAAGRRALPAGAPLVVDVAMVAGRGHHPRPVCLVAPTRARPLWRWTPA